MIKPTIILIKRILLFRLALNPEGLLPSFGIADLDERDAPHAFSGQRHCSDQRDEENERNGCAYATPKE